MYRVTKCSKFVNHSGQYILSTILLCCTFTVCEVLELMCVLSFSKTSTFCHSVVFSRNLHGYFLKIYVERTWVDIKSVTHSCSVPSIFSYWMIMCSRLQNEAFVHDRNDVSPSWSLCLQNLLNILIEHLFIYLYLSVHNNTVSNLDCVALVIVMMNWTRCGRKQLWPNIRYYAGICQVQLRKHSGFFVSQAIFHPVRNTNYKYHPLSQLALYIVY